LERLIDVAESELKVDIKKNIKFTKARTTNGDYLFWWKKQNWRGIEPLKFRARTSWEP